MDQTQIELCSLFQFVFFFFSRHIVASLRSNFSATIVNLIPVAVPSIAAASVQMIVYCSVHLSNLLRLYLASDHRFIAVNPLEDCLRPVPEQEWSVAGICVLSVCVAFTAKGSLKPIFRNLWTLSVPLNRIYDSFTAIQCAVNCRVYCPSPLRTIASNVSR